MDTKQITNDNLAQVDWARADRIAFLRSVPAMKKRARTGVAPGVAAQGVWMSDVSGSDPRSVKAQLAGRGDLRARWWNVNQAVHQFLRPRASLTHVMYAFHKRHHILTLGLLEVVSYFRTVIYTVQTKGSVEAVKVAVRMTLNGHH